MARELGSGDACQHSGGAKGAWTDKPPDIALGEAASLVTRILIPRLDATAAVIAGTWQTRQTSPVGVAVLNRNGLPSSDSTTSARAMVSTDAPAPYALGGNRGPLARAFSGPPRPGIR